MSLSTAQQQFEQILTREGEGVMQLAAILEQEHDSLTRRDADQLGEVISAKERQLQELASLAAEREAILVQAGFSTEPSGFIDFIDSDPSGSLRTLWESVEQALEKCQYQNQVNGQLLDMSKQQAEELLSLLLGKEGGANKLYDQSGNTSTSFGRNTSIKV